MKISKIKAGKTYRNNDGLEMTVIEIDADGWCKVRYVTNELVQVEVFANLAKVEIPNESNS